MFDEIGESVLENIFYYIFTGEILKNINKIKVISFTSEDITRDYFLKIE